MNRRRQLRLLFALAVLVALAAGRWLDLRAGRDAPGAEVGTEAVAELFAARRSGVWVEADGRVERTLADDREGDRHQRFLVRLANGATVLVAHNIDLAPRVPVAQGDPLTLRGRYEWNDRGGVVHWTHHDPDGSSPGGWIRLHGETYR